MKLKEKKTLGYAILSILTIVLLSIYLGKADYEKINETNKQGLIEAKDNSIKIAKKLKAYIYEVVDNTEDIDEVVASNKIQVDKDIVKIKKFTFGQVKTKQLSKVAKSDEVIPKVITKEETDNKNISIDSSKLDDKEPSATRKGVTL